MGGGAEISLCKRGPCCAQGALIKDRSRHREKVRGRLADTYCIPRRNTPARLFSLWPAMSCTRSPAAIPQRAVCHIARCALGAFPGLLAERPFFIAGKYIGAALGVGIFARRQHLIGIYI